MDVKHVLITMFNRRIDGGGARKLELDDGWLRHRWALFSSYTLPSVAAQSERDFTWLVICRPDSPDWFRELTATLETAAPVEFSFAPTLPTPRELAGRDSDLLLLTRIDSDDCWHRRAVERFRGDCEMDPYTSEILIMCDGYLLDHDARRMRPYHGASPPFSSKVILDPRAGAIDIGGAHDRVRGRLPSRSISDGEPMFVQVAYMRHTDWYGGHALTDSHRRDTARAFSARTEASWFACDRTAEVMERDFAVTLREAAPTAPAPPEPGRNGAGKPRSGARARVARTAGRPSANGSALHACQRVVVSVPCFETWDTLARAVESILLQTHTDLLVIVANDGDGDPVWEVIDHIDDPRLIRVDHATNRGRYFVDQIALMARLGPYLLIQDADDWSEPDRVEALLDELRQHHSVAAISSHYQYEAQSSCEPAVIRPALAASAVTGLYMDGLTQRLRSTYYGLFDARHLLSVGGCYGGFRIAYDTFVMHLLRMAGPVSHLDEPLYHRQVRTWSLTRSPDTGLSSATRQTVTAELTDLYEEAYLVYCEYVTGLVSATALADQIRALAWRHVSKSEWEALRDEAYRLRWQVNSPSGHVR